MAFQLKNFQVVLVILSTVFTMIFAQSQRCIDDIDLDDVQSYTYQIPNSDQKENPHYWDHHQLNYYVFGKFDDSTSDQETKITAGVYNHDKLIYETEINCNKGTYSNKILNRKSQIEVLFAGKLDRNLTSCEAGEPFDLILKVNNFNAMSWIFNAQPLQYGVKKFRKQYAHTRHAVATDHITKEITLIEAKRYRDGVIRPLTKVTSKYHAYLATKFVLKASGNARFDRLVFGQCNAWPKGMESRCQDARNWVHARSKANMTDYSMENHLEKFPLDVNITRGLGVFGNNRIVHNPLCLTTKYFNFLQSLVHPDRGIPKDPYNPSLRNMRAYCCCTNMRTGQVFKNDPENNCVFASECTWGGTSCQRAFDPTLGTEIEREFTRLREKEEKKEKEQVSEALKEHVDTESKLAAVLHINNTNADTGILAGKIPL